jgi:hypothetical protein
VPVGRRKFANQHGIFDVSAENAKNADWVADEAIWRELLSAVEFPDHQGKYREFLRFWVPQG